MRRIKEGLWVFVEGMGKEGSGHMCATGGLGVTHETHGLPPPPASSGFDQLRPAIADSSKDPKAVIIPLSSLVFSLLLVYPNVLDA